MRGGCGPSGRRPWVSWRLMAPLCLLFLFVAASTAESDDDEFLCYKMFRFSSPTKEKGAIIPRSDIIVEVGGTPSKVLCRFNDKYINSTDVYFKGKDNHEIPHKVINSTTIEAEILPLEATMYRLQCMLRRKGSDKSLCSQYVKAGFPPQDIEDLSCLSQNNENLNCTWKLPTNPILTRYNISYGVPTFTRETRCPKETLSSCYWDNGNRITKLRRDEFTLIVKGSNHFGERAYTHDINIPTVVLPNKVPVEVKLVGPTVAEVSWELKYPMHNFLTGLLHKVDYRIRGDTEWQLVEKMQSKAKIEKLENQKLFSARISLKLAYVEYEFRVRIHTLAGDLREEMWSKYDIIGIKTDSLPPKVAPMTHMSSFEVVEVLKARDIFINFEDVEPLYHGGENFHYMMLVYPDHHSKPTELQPSEITKAYFKFPALNFTEQRFVIIPVNDKGDGETYSEVVVPNSDCMPKKTEMFTVINRQSVVSLYWVPSNKPNNKCPGSTPEIISYTIYWCKKTYDDRCKEKLSWVTINVTDLPLKDLSQMAMTNTVLYEKNLTSLPAHQLHTFGVAANSGNYSSGIRWSSCIVDESDSPAPPSSVFAFAKNYSVIVKWSLKCSSLSTVPLGYNVSYCLSTIPDFGHCLGEEHSVRIDSPEANYTIISDYLKPGFSYIFSVSVLSYIGEGKQSKPVLANVPAAKPTGPPLNLSISKNKTSVLVQWQHPNPMHRNGKIISYKIRLLETDELPIYYRVPHNRHSTFFEQRISGLKPYQRYHVQVLACTIAGCSEEINAAVQEFRTKEGVPNNVSLDLDVSNWRLVWSLDRCNSRTCNFEVSVAKNETINTFNVTGKEVLHLYKVGVNCTNAPMNFSIRAIGKKDNGEALFGDWTTIEKPTDECPQELPLLFIILMASGVAIFVVILALLAKFGFRTISDSIKDWRMKIRLPIGMDENIKHIHDFPRDPRRKSSEPLHAPPLLYKNPISQDGPLVSLPPPPQEDGGGRSWPKRSSLSSEEVNLIDNLEGERHGRNLSGSSQHSSGQDSAMMSESPSVTEGDHDNSLSEMNLRQRIPQSHAYVQHGMVPDKGYVTARSVPSLPHLYTGAPAIFERPDQNLNGSLQIFTNPNSAQLNQESIILTRRASTGYVSMIECESGKTSPCMKDPRTSPSLGVGEPSAAMPAYIKHSFDPRGTKAAPPQHPWLPSGYVALTDPPSASPTPINVGYVSASDPFGGAKKSADTRPLEDDSHRVAYCRVGSREDTADGHQFEHALPPPTADAVKSPYVTCSEAFLLSRQGPDSQNASQSGPVEVSHSTPYVQLADTSTSNWGGQAGPTDSPQRVPPLGGGKPNSRNTVGPSLSKQSSGYVSQEAIPVVISPKRLLAQSQIPHSVVLSQNHQASMV